MGEEIPCAWTFCRLDMLLRLSFSMCCCRFLLLLPLHHHRS